MITAETQGDNVALERSLVGYARAENADLRMSAATVVAASQAANLHQSAAMAVLSNNEAVVKQGYGTFVVSRRNMSVKQGGGQWMLATGNMDVLQGGGAVMVATKAKVQQSFVGMLIAGSAEIEDGTRVMIRPAGAAALGVGFAAGLLAFARFFLLRGRKRGALRLARRAR